LALHPRKWPDLFSGALYLDIGLCLSQYRLFRVAFVAEAPEENKCLERARECGKEQEQDKLEMWSEKAMEESRMTFKSQTLEE